jgi:uncharacterized protein YecE (DUF72 family)
MAKAFIGTSGWVYEDWWKRFYPVEIKPEERLEYYSKSFATVELNASFYHLPRKKTFGNWSKKTPVSFAFSVKLSKYITHNLKLKSAKESLQLFLNEAKGLGNKLSVVLVQLPPNLKKDTERLKNFLVLIRENPVKTRWAFEFRHESWLEEEIFDLLKNSGAGFVIQDSAGRWPSAEVATGDFVYLRFHGPSDLYSSNYPDKSLKEWAKKTEKWLAEGLDVYAYFNNDVNAFAVRNAMRLKELVKV